MLDRSPNIKTLSQQLPTPEFIRRPCITGRCWARLGLRMYFTSMAGCHSWQGYVYCRRRLDYNMVVCYTLLHKLLSNLSILPWILPRSTLYVTNVLYRSSKTYGGRAPHTSLLELKHDINGTMEKISPVYTITFKYNPTSLQSCHQRAVH